MTVEFTPEMKRFIDSSWPWNRTAGENPVWETIPSDGSDRIFIRVQSGPNRALLVLGPDPVENRAYEMIGRHLQSLQIGPGFYRADRPTGLTLIEDLGDLSLYDAVQGLPVEKRIEQYTKVLEVMIVLHREGARNFDPGWCSQTPRYDKALILERETAYFQTEFLEGLLRLPPLGSKLAGTFGILADAALEGTETVLMHRDFQSRNVMIADELPRLIDFQGARLGPPGIRSGQPALRPLCQSRSIRSPLPAGILYRSPPNRRSIQPGGF